LVLLEPDKITHLANRVGGVHAELNGAQEGNEDENQKDEQ